MSTSTAVPAPTLHLSIHDLHRFYSSHSGSVQGRYCGQATLSGSGQTLKKITTIEGKTFGGFGQRQSHSPTTCPTGHAKAAAGHQADLQHVLEQHTATGGSIIFGTFTIKSDPVYSPAGFSSIELGLRALPQYRSIKSSSLSAGEKKASLAKLRESFERVAEPNSWDKGWRVASQLAAVREGLTRMFAGNVWAREVKKFGIIGRATSIEIVLTPASSPAIAWRRVRANIHVHFLLLTEKQVTSTTDVAALKKSLHGRWARVAKKHGHRSLLTHQQLVIAAPEEELAPRISSYITKGSLHAKHKTGDEVSYGLPMFAPLFLAAQAEAEGLPVPVGAVTFWKNLEALLAGVHLYRLTPSLLKKYGVKEVRATRKAEASAKVLSVEELAVVDKKEWIELEQKHPDIVGLVREAAAGPAAAEALSELLSDLNLSHFLLRPQSGHLLPPAGL